MGNSQAVAFREQFTVFQQIHSSTSRVWIMYDAVTTAPSPNSKESDESKPSSGAPAKVERPVSVFRLNCHHPTIEAALAPPKKGAPPPMWKPVKVCDELYSLMKDKPHPCLLPVEQTVAVDNDFYVVSPVSGTVPLVTVLATYSVTELLYGLVNVVSGLMHLHAQGYAHRNLTFDAIYVLRNTNRQHWCIGDLHFCSKNDTNTKDTRANQTALLLNETCTLREAAHIPFIAPEERNPMSSNADFTTVPIYAADMFGFGVLLEYLLADTVPKKHGGSHGSTPQSVLDSLRKYSRQCQDPNPALRPSPQSFLELPCIAKCTFVQLMRFLDVYPEHTLEERRAFFSALHVSLYKIPYDVLLSRVMPRMLTVALWKQREAELFLRHLVTPIRKVTADAIVVPWQKKEADIETNTPKKLASAPLVEPPSSPGSSEASSVAIYGIVLLSDYVALLSDFIAGIFKYDDAQLLCTLLRLLEYYVVAIDMRVVNETVIPSLVRCLRHPAAEVVFEALRSFLVLCRFVFNAVERGADVGSAYDQLTKVFDREVFALSTTDPEPNVRMFAMSVAFRSFSSRTKLLSRAHAVASLCYGLQMPTTATSYEVCLKTIGLVERVIDILSPLEIVSYILPALVALIRDLHTAFEDPRLCATGVEIAPAYSKALELLAKIVLHVNARESAAEITVVPHEDSAPAAPSAEGQKKEPAAPSASAEAGAAAALQWVEVQAPPPWELEFRQWMKRHCPEYKRVAGANTASPDCTAPPPPTKVTWDALPAWCNADNDHDWNSSGLLTAMKVAGRGAPLTSRAHPLAIRLSSRALPREDVPSPQSAASEEPPALSLAPTKSHETKPRTRRAAHKATTKHVDVVPLPESTDAVQQASIPTPQASANAAVPTTTQVAPATGDSMPSAANHPQAPQEPAVSAGDDYVPVVAQLIPASQPTPPPSVEPATKGTRKPQGGVAPRRRLASTAIVPNPQSSPTKVAPVPTAVAQTSLTPADIDL